MNDITTDGARFAATARRNFRIGTTTRRRRDGIDVRADLVEGIVHAATLPGYYSEKTQASLRLGYAAVCGYAKHIEGYRAAPRVVAKVQAMTPYQFTKLLADMVDAGVSNQYEAERYFQTL